MIDVYILADALGGTVAGGSASDSEHRERLNLSGVRLWDGGREGPEEGCIYVADASEARDIPDTFAASAFAFVDAIDGAGATSFKPDTSVPPCLLLPEVYTKASALSAIQRVFERFSDVWHDVVDATCRREPVSDIFIICASVLANPVVLFDSTLSVVAVSKDLGSGKSDMYWDYTLGRTKLEDEPPFTVDYNDLLESTEPIYGREGDLETLDTCVRVDGQIVAFLSATNVEAPITEGEISRYLWVQRLLETLWFLIAQNSEHIEMSDQVFLRAVDGLPTDGALVSQLLAQRKWEASGSYRLLSMFRTQGDPLAVYDTKPIKRDLSNLFSSAPIIMHGDELLVVLYNGTCEQAVHGKAFRNLLAMRDLTCAVSEEEPGLENLNRAYAQCKAVRARAKPGSMERVIDFQSVCMDCIMDAYEDSDVADALFVPQVESLLSRNNGMELVQSLRAYLGTGRSLVAASEQLSVHRNTLRYRIEQVERWTGLDLGEIDETMMFRLYMTCLLLERRS